jgi:prepilin-type N-terminal cleavage/methylation domain-containing protein
VTRQAKYRARERGFTLVEVLVSMALLGIIGAALGIVFSLGMRTILAPGASQDRLVAASDTIAFEQPFIQDVQRASCIHFPGNPQYSDGCAGESVPFQAQQAQCSGRSTLLCLEWPDLVSSGQCDMALYALSTNPVSRIAWEGSTETSTSFSGVTVQILSTSGSQPAGLDVLVTSDGPLPASPPATALANPPSITLDLQTLSAAWPTLPPSPSTVSTSPC